MELTMTIHRVHLTAAILLSFLSANAWGYTMSMSLSKHTGTGPAIVGRKAFIVTLATSTAALIQNSPENNAAVAANLPQTGVKAPAFELPSSRGEMTTLETLTKTGKWTVLYFYPGAFTSGCTLEARGFQRDIQEYSKLNAQLVGVSVDSVEKNAQFCQEEKLDFYMLSDAGGKVSKLYGSALSIPGFGTFSNRQTYLIDPKGSLRWVFTDVESHVPRHSTEVLQKLTEVQKEDNEV
jgi:peroxiredoxin Q/BCP